MNISQVASPNVGETKSYLSSKIPKQPHSTTQSEARDDLIAPVISAIERPLQLLQSSILNKLMAERLTEDAVSHHAYVTPEEDTPKSTANNIVSQAISYFELFKKQYPDKSEAEVVEKYMETVGMAIGAGFVEAQTSLENLGLDKDAIIKNLDKTNNLIQVGLIKFKSQFVE